MPVFTKWRKESSRISNSTSQISTQFLLRLVVSIKKIKENKRSIIFHILEEK